MGHLLKLQFVVKNAHMYHTVTVTGKSLVLFPVLWNYETNELRILNFAFRKLNVDNLLYGWEASIRNNYKQIGVVSARAIIEGELPGSLIGYISQAKDFKKRAD